MNMLNQHVINTKSVSNVLPNISANIVEVLIVMDYVNYVVMISSHVPNVMEVLYQALMVRHMKMKRLPKK